MRIDNSFLMPTRISAPIRPTLGEEETQTERKGFQNILDDLMKSSTELSDVSRENTALLLTGQLEDLPAARIASEESSIMFELNLTVRAKVIDAYNEIMQTGV